MRTGETKRGLLQIIGFTLALLLTLCSTMFVFGFIDNPEAFARSKSVENPDGSTGYGGGTYKDNTPSTPPEVAGGSKLGGANEVLATIDAPIIGEDGKRIDTKITLVDEATKASITGYIEEGATLNVIEGDVALHDDAVCEACKTIREKTSTSELSIPFKVEIEGASADALEGTFHVGSEFDERNVAVYRCVGGTFEQTTSVVRGGAVFASLTKGQPFAFTFPKVVIPDEKESEVELPVHPLFILFVIGIVAYCIYCMVFKKDATSEGE